MVRRTKPTILILLPMVWSIRNVVHAGVLEQLAAADINVHLLMREQPTQNTEIGSFSAASSCELLLSPTRIRHIKGRSLLRDCLNAAHNKRNRIESYRIYRRWYTRDASRLQRLHEHIVEAIGFVLQTPTLFTRACQIYKKLYLQEYDLSKIKAQLQRLKPDLIWSTANVEPNFEPAYMLTAQALGIPTVTSILSFDNLSSKSTHLNYLIYNRYLVWNQRMQDQLLQFFPAISRDQITITGTSQFDFHRRSEYLWKREKTLKQLGLPEGSRYFLYTTSVASLAPSEPELVRGLASRMRSAPLLKDYWLVVRCHPKDEVARWSPVLGTNKVMLSNSWSTTVNSNADYWAISTQEDQGRFVSSLVHCEACLNIASTTTLDAAILDRPVIGIRFDNELRAPAEILYEEYDATHYRPLVESGGLRVARSWDELLRLMQLAIDAPALDSAKRVQMVELDCGPVDGHCADRISSALIAYLQDTN